jgi:hypothetical protein
MVRRSEPWSILRRSCLSADVLGPLLLVGFLFGLGSGWKLQDCCILTFLEMSQKHLLAEPRVVPVRGDPREGRVINRPGSAIALLFQLGVQRDLCIEHLRDWTGLFGDAGQLPELRLVEVRHAGPQRQC